MQAVSWKLRTAADDFEKHAPEMRMHIELLRDAGALVDELAEALRPFAQHVGKSGEAVTLTIGKDKWTASLTPADFERARSALAKLRSEQARR